MAIAFKQLELDLWGDLQSALAEPETADLQQLWQELDSAITPLEKNQAIRELLKFTCHEPTVF